MTFVKLPAMGAYDTERVNEVCLLLHRCETDLGNWIGFQCDYPVEFKKIVYWALHNSSSPLGWLRDGKPTRRSVIEWRTDTDPQWTTNVKAPAVLGPTGRRGRIRLRRPRTTS